ncbi:MAG: glycoside hydrolase family 5 protein [Agathobacter sp.]|nr:glycoside hydrolase family 5 protein [Agathobacter sp.]
MKLMRGINLGGYLSQCEHTTEHYNAFLKEEDIHKIAGMGFDHVRLAIDYEVLEDEQGRTKEEGFAYVTRTVEWCKRHGLNIVLDLHKAYGYDFNYAGDTEKNNLFSDKKVQKRFVDLWIKIAERYANDTNVAFELLNEVVEQENADAWNHLIAETVDAIRRIARDTIIIYGGIQWNSVATLKLLEKPKDENIMFTFHFYEPLLFTHQKAYWVPAIKDVEDISYPEEMEYYRIKSTPIGYQGEAVCKAHSQVMGPEFIAEMVMEAVTAAKDAGVSLYCGEFGVIDQAPIADTFRWFRDVDTVFRHFGIGSAVWTYKEMDFGIMGDHYEPIREQLLKLWNQK